MLAGRPTNSGCRNLIFAIVAIFLLLILAATVAYGSHKVSLTHPYFQQGALLIYDPQAPSFKRPHATALAGEAVLHVCTIITNPVRYAARYKLFDGFRAQNEGGDIKHWTVEVAYGNRPFAVTERDNPMHLQLRTHHEIWHKENALNLLFAQILSVCPDAEYFAWVDADVTFVRPDWAYETLQQLQHYDVVQMFSHSQDVGPKFEPIGGQHIGFVYSYCNGLPQQGEEAPPPSYYGYSSNGFGHPGYAWAARRVSLDVLGGLIDFCILGSADHHMALALIGQVERSIHPDLADAFKSKLRIWEGRAEKYIRRNIGYVDGVLNHHWHGRKADRRYRDRWKVLITNQYNPELDLKRDTQGLFQLTERSRELRDDIRSYFRSRNEDSIDVN